MSELVDWFVLGLTPHLEKPAAVETLRSALNELERRTRIDLYEGLAMHFYPDEIPKLDEPWSGWRCKVYVERDGEFVPWSKRQEP